MADPTSIRRMLWPVVIVLLVLLLLLVVLNPLGDRTAREEGAGPVGGGLPERGEPAGEAAPTVDTQPTEAIPVPVPRPVQDSPPAQETPSGE